MSAKAIHEVRDPIHTFIHFSNDEKKIIASPYFQRLRHVKQLSMACFVYPGATHTRFEHSIGVMELAGRVFDVLFDNNNRHTESCEPFREKFNDDPLKHNWRRHVRMAALLHDVGHPSLSHATESLFPEGENHESMTKRIILDSELTAVLQDVCETPYRPTDIAKLAVGEKYFPSEPFDVWTQLLHEIIAGDAFGVDRIDYLLRDAHHAGIVAGHFDHDRLIESLRVLRPPEDQENGAELSIGIEHGGIHPTEALLVARYFMYMQVYYHRVATAYNVHAERFAKSWLNDKHEGHWPTDPERFLAFTDDELHAEIRRAASNQGAAGHVEAKRIIGRDHFQMAYEFGESDAHVLAAEKVQEQFQQALAAKFTSTDFYLVQDKHSDQRHSPALKDSFPVWNRKVGQGHIEDGKRHSHFLKVIASPYHHYVIADRAKKEDIKSCVTEFLERNKSV